jgi:hypothetical protein
MAMNVFVCGDSFMSPDPLAPGKHFSELLGSTSLALPGVSNIDTCFQIKEAIDKKADYVIIGTTDSGRIELSMTDKTHNDINLLNLRNGDYISSTIPTFIGEEWDLRDKHKLSPEVRDAVKKYFLHIYDKDIKILTDMWAIYFWISKLESLDIRYTLLPKSFCIYQYAIKNPTEPWTFHTNFETQEQASHLLRKDIQ